MHTPYTLMLPCPTAPNVFQENEGLTNELEETKKRLRSAEDKLENAQTELKQVLLYVPTL